MDNNQRPKKFVQAGGNLMNEISPLMLSGSLIASGVPFADAYERALAIVNLVPDSGISNEDYIALVINFLSGEEKVRYVVLKLVKLYLLSKKNSSPFFIFIGGMGGKTILGNYIAPHLRISQAIAIDNEKYRIVDPSKDQDYLWKATYESAEGYVKTVEALTPWMMKMLDRNRFDFRRFRKWCYLWEGICLTPKSVKELMSKAKRVHHLSVFILPAFDDIRKRYLIRWQEELGIEQLKKRRNIIDRYLQNIQVIRSHIADHIDPVASFVIGSTLLEERLEAFYALLYQKLKDIADSNIKGWVEKIAEDPKRIKKFTNFLE